MSVLPKQSIPMKRRIAQTRLGNSRLVAFFFMSSGNDSFMDESEKYPLTIMNNAILKEYMCRHSELSIDGVLTKS